MFTILLTRHKQEEGRVPINWGGVLVGLAVFVGLLCALVTTEVPSGIHGNDVMTIKQVGQELMSGYVWPLEAVGVLLTAALIGSLILVLEKKIR